MTPPGLPPRLPPGLPLALGPPVAAAPMSPDMLEEIHLATDGLMISFGRSPAPLPPEPLGLATAIYEREVRPNPQRYPHLAHAAEHGLPQLLQDVDKHATLRLHMRHGQSLLTLYVDSGESLGLWRLLVTSKLAAADLALCVGWPVDKLGEAPARRQWPSIMAQFLQEQRQVHVGLGYLA